MRADAVIAGAVGGTMGLVATAALTWVTWAVYRDGEFDVPGFMVVYTLAVFATAVLQMAGALKSRLRATPPEARYFIASGGTTLAASLAGAAFAFIGVGSSGSGMFFLLFVVLPTLFLGVVAVAGGWFAMRGAG